MVAYSESDQSGSCKGALSGIDCREPVRPSTGVLASLIGLFVREQRTLLKVTLSPERLRRLRMQGPYSPKTVRVHSIGHPPLHENLCTRDAGLSISWRALKSLAYLGIYAALEGQHE